MTVCTTIICTEVLFARCLVLVSMDAITFIDAFPSRLLPGMSNNADDTVLVARMSETKCPFRLGVVTCR